MSITSSTLPTTPTQLHTYDVSVAAGASTATIQKAINNAYTNGGGTVTLAAGTYTITTPVILKSNVTITGAGKSSTILKRASSSDLGTGCSVITVSSGGISNVIISALTIDANTSIDPSSSPDKDSWSNGGVLITDTDETNDNIMFNNIVVKNATMGFHIKGTTNLTVKNSDFYNNGGCYKYWHNMYLRRIYYVNIYNCNLYSSNSGNGINISFCTNILIDTCNCYSNYFRGIRAADSSYIDVLDCNIYSNKNGDGIIFNTDTTTGVDNFIIKSNTVSDNGGYGIRTNGDCSDGEVYYNIDGGGNSSGFKSLSGNNIDYEE